MLSVPFYAVDINHFISESGWFTFPGMALGKNALFNVLARMSFTEYEDFMKIQESVYIFTYGNDEKVFVGKSQVLHEELEKHFSCFLVARERRSERLMMSCATTPHRMSGS